jgi:hypothetical protein
VNIFVRRERLQDGAKQSVIVDTYVHWNKTIEMKSKLLAITMPPPRNINTFILDHPGPSSRYSMASIDNLVKFEPRSKRIYVTRLRSYLGSAHEKNLVGWYLSL